MKSQFRCHIVEAFWKNTSSIPCRSPNILRLMILSKVSLASVGIDVVCSVNTLVLYIEWDSEISKRGFKVSHLENDRIKTYKGNILYFLRDLVFNAIIDLYGPSFGRPYGTPNLFVILNPGINSWAIFDCLMAMIFRKYQFTWFIRHRRGTNENSPSIH